MLLGCLTSIFEIIHISIKTEKNLEETKKVPKGYWINHVEEIIDQEAFDRYVTKVNALIERGEF